MGLKTLSFTLFFPQTSWLFLQILRELLTLIPVKQTELQTALHFLLFHVSNYSSWIPCGLNFAFQERENHFISFIHPHKTVTVTLKHSKAMTSEGHGTTRGWESQACGLDLLQNHAVPQSPREVPLQPSENVFLWIRKCPAPRFHTSLIRVFRKQSKVPEYMGGCPGKLGGCVCSRT